MRRIVLIISIAVFMFQLSAQDLGQIYEMAEDVIVQLYIDGRGMISHRHFAYRASGFVIHPEGYIATCAHFFWGEDEKDLLEIAYLAVLLSDGRRFGLEDLDENLKPNPVLDLDRDIAILKFKVQEELPVLKLGNEAQLFDEVIAMGYAEAWARPVASLARVCGFTFEGMILTDAAVTHGMSGGPLISLSEGQIVGMIAASRDGLVQATPISQIIGLISETTGHKGF